MKMEGLKVASPYGGLTMAIYIGNIACTLVIYIIDRRLYEY